MNTWPAFLWHRFFDREWRSKVLKEALLFLLLACWEHEQKCCKPNKNCAKNVPTSQNEVHKGSKGANFYILWHFMTLNCHVFLVWPFVAMYGHAVAFQGHRHVWPHSTKHVLCDLVWACMALYGLAWRCMAFLWSHMIFYGRILSFLAVKNSNSFGLVQNHFGIWASKLFKHSYQRMNSCKISIIRWSSRTILILNML